MGFQQVEDYDYTQDQRAEQEPERAVEENIASRFLDELMQYFKKSDGSPDTNKTSDTGTKEAGKNEAATGLNEDTRAASTKAEADKTDSASKPSHGQSVDLHGNKKEISSESELTLWATYYSLENGGDGIRLHKNGDITLRLAGGGIFEIWARDKEIRSTAPFSSYQYDNGVQRINFKDDDVSIEVKNGRVINLSRDGKKHNFTYAPRPGERVAN